MLRAEGGAGVNRPMKRAENVDLRFAAPPSKSYTHRALLIGALAKGTTVIRNPLVSVDTALTMRALVELGVAIEAGEDFLVVKGCNGKFSPGKEVVLDLENSGTSLRLLASAALFCDAPVTLTGSERMQERPIGPLADALVAAGGKVTYLNRKGFPPIRVEGRFFGGEVPVDGAVSSQFVSSLLLVAPYAEQETVIFLQQDPASRSYVDVTIQVMEQFGVKVWRTGYRTFRVGNRARYTGREYTVEGDYSSASYFLAIPAVCGGTVTVTGLNPVSTQGERRFVSALAAMGCTVTLDPESITVTRKEPLHGITIDMSTAPDTVQTLAIVAALAKGRTMITGIDHLAYKESNRLEATARLLKSLGAHVEVTRDSLEIVPAILHGGTIDPQNDHRTAMSFAILGLAVGDITITDAGCVNKSFPGFWEALDKAGL